jgi:hypothetical protein
MGTVEKVAMGVVGIAMITTAILPGRQTVPVVNAFSNFVRGLFATVMAVPRR